MIVNANSVHIPLQNESVHCVVTSPPYWSMRDYQLDPTDWAPVEYAPMAGLASLSIPAWRGCLGLEPTPEMFVAHIVAMFREVKRVLRDDGVLWLNFGDSYINNPSNGRGGTRVDGGEPHLSGDDKTGCGLPSKNLAGIPWRVAFALQADGWWLRSDIVWLKDNPMPESCVDRPTKAHEYLFLLSKSARYFYDAEAVRETAATGWNDSSFTDKRDFLTKPGLGKGKRNERSTRNRRTTDWYDYDAAIAAHRAYIRHLRRIRDDGGLLLDTDGTPIALHVNPASFKGAHFATYPVDLVLPCILAGTSARGCCPICGKAWERVVEKTTSTPGQKPGYTAAPGVLRNDGNRAGHFIDHKSSTTGWRPTCDHDAEPVPCIVLDPFAGSGTTGEACRMLPNPCRFVGLDLSGDYLRDFALPRAERKQTKDSITELPLFKGLE